MAKYVGVYTAPPATVGLIDSAINAYRMPDGPVMGNGDIGVAVGGSYTEQTYYFSKSDLSQINRGLGGVTFRFEAAPQNESAYRQEQDLLHAEVRSTVPFDGATVHLRSWVSDTENRLVTELWTEGDRSVPIELSQWSHPNSSITQAGSEENQIWSTREMDIRQGSKREHFISRVAMATRVMGTDVTGVKTNGTDASSLRFALDPGQKVTVITAVAGGYQAEGHITQANRMVASLTPRELKADYENHLAWWEEYWAKSEVEIDSEWVEKYYYGALYVLGCSSRAGAVAPGLAGIWHLHGPICWTNRYTLNYNFESPWWGVFAGNRPELALPYFDVILGIIPPARELAKEHGTKGVFFPINAHAWGGFMDERTLNMKSNASLAFLNFMFYYNYTQDDNFLLNKAWPLLKELLLFWEDNLVWENEHWVIHDSGGREGHKDTNPINDLGYVNAIYRFIVKNHSALEGKVFEGETIRFTEAEKAQWQHCLDHMSPYPTMDFDGMITFKESDNRDRISVAGPGDNTDVLMGVFPGEAVSMGSDPQWLQIAYNTVAAMNSNPAKESWYNGNSLTKIYTQAIRSGYPAQIVLEKLEAILRGEQPYFDRNDTSVRLRNNFTIVPAGHSFESVGAIEAIHSMLLQSHDGVIRLFPVWVENKPARFHQLRACGAFLVSSEYKDAEVSYVEILSEAGKFCVVENPWKGQIPQVYALNNRDTPIATTLSGDNIRFQTKPGACYRIQL